MRHHRIPMTPHRFTPGAVADWNGEHRFCDHCGMPREHRAHAEYIEPEGDRSDAILGEHEEVNDDAA